MARKPIKRIKTERDWRNCIWPAVLFSYLRGEDGPFPPSRSSNRKLRLFACARCRRIWHLLPSDLCYRAVELSEGFADRLVPKKEVEAVGRAVVAALPGLENARIRHAVAGAAFGSYETSFAFAGLSGSALSIEEAAHCDLLRDIFGNPFRPVKLKRAWLTSDVLALARGIYEDHAFDRMPILADALQDAGCDNESVLNHCRDANQVHVRGCWVVDLLLGKE